MAAEQKTNAMRILEQKKIPYKAHTYPHGDTHVDGVTIAVLTGQSPERVFKTLVAQGASRQYYVFVLPVAAELDLKKAARVVGEKSMAMIPVKELTPLTGYVRGGCSPIGMKKSFCTTLAQQAADQSTILISGGRIGDQIELSPDTLLTLVRQGQYADITVDE